MGSSASKSNGNDSPESKPRHGKDTYVLQLPDGVNLPETVTSGTAASRDTSTSLEMKGSQTRRLEWFAEDFHPALDRMGSSLAIQEKHDGQEIDPDAWQKWDPKVGDFVKLRNAGNAYNGRSGELVKIEKLGPEDQDAQYGVLQYPDGVKYWIQLPVTPIPTFTGHTTPKRFRGVPNGALHARDIEPVPCASYQIGPPGPPPKPKKCDDEKTAQPSRNRRASKSLVLRTVWKKIPYGDSFYYWNQDTNQTTETQPDQYQIDHGYVERLCSGSNSSSRDTRPWKQIPHLGSVCYYNPATKKSRWLNRPPENQIGFGYTGWKPSHDRPWKRIPQGGLLQVYYWNEESNETTWFKPFHRHIDVDYVPPTY